MEYTNLGLNNERRIGANHLEPIGGGKLLYTIAHFATTNSSNLCGCVQEKLVES